MLAPLKKAGQSAVRHWPVTAILVAAALVIMTPHTLERMFVYYPMREVSGNPSGVGLQYRDIYPVAEDGVKLHGWFVPYPSAASTLLIFHGNAGNIWHRLPWIQMLHQLRVNIFIIDYRGFGRSEGQPFERGLYRDARAAHNWWKSEHGRTGGKLILLGESLGGAVAVDLAASVPVDALILQSTFSSGRDMARTVFPLGLLQPLIGVHFDSAAKISGIKCPKLFIHGNRDDIVPLRLGRKLFDRAPEPKDFYEVADAGHNDLIWAAGPEYSQRIRRFVAAIGQ